MSWFTNALTSPIGQKILMALSGLLLISFLVVHLTGNLMLLNHNPDPFNRFVDFMEGNPIVGLLEYGLFGGFILHIVVSVMLTRQNRRARPVKYAKQRGGENSTWFSRNMGLTGSIVFVFLVIHLRTFFVPEKILHTDPRTFYDVALDAFSSPVYVTFYVVSMFLLALHLRHGFQSAFQTLGIRHPKYSPLIKFVGTAFAVLVPFLFALIPVMVLFR